MTRLLVLLLSVGLCSAYKHYQLEIPNGDRVPHPGQNGIWQGVGHLIADGGGARNPFGTDFAANGFVWDTTLCQKDSDSDGKTNGAELGDPNCVWTKGETPSSTTGLSHPGICDDINSSACQNINNNNNIDLSSGAPFECAETSNSGVLETTYSFPSYNVPAKVTNYYCKYFPVRLDPGESHHIIAYKPAIDNIEVMHHILVYGCHGDAPVGDSVQDCEEGMSECNELVMVWAVGINGFCFPNMFGTLIGEGGYTGFWMEHHWNNPRKASDLFDASGITVYHTPNLRTSEARYIIWGPLQFELEPLQKEVYAAGMCPNRRTKNMVQDHMKITQIIPHMHYLGRKMVIKHEGTVILTDDSYSYDSPKVYDFDPPLEFARGDEVTIECTFDTSSTSETTYYGPATNDEMCFMVAQVYPYDTSIPTFCGVRVSGADPVMNRPVSLIMITMAVLVRVFA